MRQELARGRSVRRASKSIGKLQKYIVTLEEMSVSGYLCMLLDRLSRR